MPVPSGAREYVLKALAGNPQIFVHLLREQGDTSPIWDEKPFADRFTLREAIAHVADWEAIWLERFTRIATEDEPVLPDVDEGAVAVEREYSALSPVESLRRYALGRAELVGFLRSLPEEAWDRVGEKNLLGRLTLFEFAALTLGHDSYHLRQVVEYLETGCGSGAPLG